MRSSGIEWVIEQHRDEAGFLWTLRSQALDAPDCTLDDLLALDRRLDSHIDGLRIAGERGWKLCEEALSFQDPGEVFTAAVLALESPRPERIEAVLATAEASELFRPLASSLAWIPWPQSEPSVRRWLSSGEPWLRRIAVAAFALHRQVLREELIAALHSDDARILGRGLKAAGELGNPEILPLLGRHLENPDGDCRFHAAKSAALLGEPRALGVLQAIAATGGPRAEASAATSASLTKPGDAGAWIRGLEKLPGGRRLAVIAAGRLGDPAQVPWLIDCMRLPELARPAGEAFQSITGADLEDADLESEAPKAFDIGPSEEPEDDNVALDPDEKLPWPDPERVARWWRTRKNAFAAGVRFMDGKPVSLEQARHVLRWGRQRQRADAALHAARLLPGRPLFEIRERGDRQLPALTGYPSFFIPKTPVSC